MRFLFLILFLFSWLQSKSQYFQQQVNYDLSVEHLLDSSLILVSGNMVYHNNSPDALDTIYMHLWANAFSNNSTEFARQSLKLQSLAFHFADKKDRGGYRFLKFQGPGNFEISHLDKDKGFIKLARPLLPGDSVVFKLNYQLKVPKLFSRFGKNDQGDYHIVHWYPKPAVLDEEGWHWFSYLSLGEFYGEYGNYRITLKTDKAYQVSHSGNLTSIQRSGAITTYNLEGESVFDVALFLTKNMEKEQIEIESVSGKNVVLEVAYPIGDTLWKNHALYYLNESFEYYEKQIGVYPWPKLTLVNGRKGGNSGMEYPMVIEVSAKDKANLRYYINHEVGHQWFYGIMGFNEREYPFLDEGLTTFYEHKYTQNILGTEHHTLHNSLWPKEVLEMPLLQYLHVFQKRRRFDESPSEDPRTTSILNYGLNAYEKAAYSYRFLEGYVGVDNFSKGIRSYFKKWSGRHPTLKDFIQEMEMTSNLELEWFHQIIAEKSDIELTLEKEGDKYWVINKGNTAIPVHIETIDSSFWIPPLDAGKQIAFAEHILPISVNKDYLGLERDASDNFLQSSDLNFVLGINLDHSQKQEMYYLPAVRYNYADGLGLGISLYNSSLLPKSFQFLIDPQYGMRSREIVGNAWMAHNYFLRTGLFRKIQSKLSLKRYHDYFDDDEDLKSNYFRFSPQVSLHLNTDPASQLYSKLTFQSIHLKLNALNFGPLKISEWQHLWRMRYDYFDYFALNRKEFWIELEYQKYKSPLESQENYLKATSAFQYRTSFRPGKSVSFRLFSAVFIHNSQRLSKRYNDFFSRGSIALLAQSFNDYSRDHYFLNRQQTGNFINQILPDGGRFKDALGKSDIGVSNDFAISANINIDLPISFPLLFKPKLYADIGYYRARSSAQFLEGNYLASGGIMLSYIDQGFEIYFPLWSSNKIASIYKENGESFFQKISFKIDLHRLNPWDLLDDLNL